MKCANNYFGASCNVICVAQDNCDGHYTCDPNTGQKLCKYGFIDPSTNCVKQDPLISICSQG